MGSREELPTEEREITPPNFLVPGVRCGLEMALVGFIVALIGLPAQNTLVLGFVVLLTMVSMVVVLFWCLNLHMAEWIRRAQGTPTKIGT